MHYLSFVVKMLHCGYVSSGLYEHWLFKFRCAIMTRTNIIGLVSSSIEDMIELKRS